MVRSLLCFLVLTVLLVACSQPSSAPLTPVVQTGATASPRAISASPVPSSPIQFTQVQVTPADAVIELQNTGGPSQASTVDVSGWALQVGSTRVELPAGTRVQPGQTLRVHAGPPPGLSPSPLPVPSGAASPVAAASPLASPSAVAAVEVFLGPSGAALRDALQPGAQIDLVDTKNVLQSQYTLPRQAG
jgi:hypothetical protein